MQATEQFAKVVQDYLEKRASEDPLFAPKFNNEKKNIKDCVTYILNTVQKSGRAGFADDEVFGMAVHYYELKNSLILSAQVNGVRTETIEVCLNPLKISQTRGKNNQSSKYHDRILQLLEANLHQIKKRMRVHSKKSIEKLETVAA